MSQIKIAIKYRPYCMIQLKTHSLSLLIRNSHHQPKTYPKYYQRIRNFRLKIQNKYPQRIKNNCSLQKTLNKHRLKILLLNLYILSLKKMVLANYLVKFKMILTKNKRKFKMARKKQLKVMMMKTLITTNKTKKSLLVKNNPKKKKLLIKSLLKFNL